MEVMLCRSTLGRGGGGGSGFALPPLPPQFGRPPTNIETWTRAKFRLETMRTSVWRVVGHKSGKVWLEETDPTEAECGGGRGDAGLLVFAHPVSSVFLRQRLGCHFVKVGLRA